MSNIKKAVVRFNGQELVATYDAETQLWTATATAPATSSYGQPDHVYKAEVFAQDQAGNSATVNSSDPTYGAQLKIRVLEKTKPEGQIRTPSNGSVLGANTQNVVIAVSDNGGSGLNNASFKLKVNNTAIPLKTGEAGDYRYSCVCYHCQCRRPHRLHLQGDRRRPRRQRLIGSYYDHTGMG